MLSRLYFLPELDISLICSYLFKFYLLGEYVNWIDSASLGVGTTALFITEGAAKTQTSSKRH